MFAFPVISQPKEMHWDIRCPKTSPVFGAGTALKKMVFALCFVSHNYPAGSFSPQGTVTGLLKNNSRWKFCTWISAASGGWGTWGDSFQLFTLTNSHWFFCLPRCFPGSIPVLHGDRWHASLLHGVGSGTVQPRGSSRGLEDLPHI